MTGNNKLARGIAKSRDEKRKYYIGEIEKYFLKNKLLNNELIYNLSFLSLNRLYNLINMSKEEVKEEIKKEYKLIRVGKSTTKKDVIERVFKRMKTTDNKKISTVIKNDNSISSSIDKSIKKIIKDKNEELKMEDVTEDTKDTIEKYIEIAYNSLITSDNNILRNSRTINKDKNLVTQKVKNFSAYSSLNSMTLKEYYNMYNEVDIRLLNERYLRILEGFRLSFNDISFKSYRITYITIKEEELKINLRGNILSGNPIIIDELNDEIKRIITREDYDNKALNVNFYSKSYAFEDMHTMDDLTYMMQDNDNSEGIIKIIIKIEMLYTLLNTEKNLINNFKNVMAFSPSSNQSYHRLTAISTSLGSKCIYETYFFLYNNIDTIIGNIKQIYEALEKESKEVIEMVKNGKLYEFMKYMSVKHDEKFYVQYFEFMNKEVKGFSVLGDEVEEIKDIETFNNKKVFLYNNNHVAPRRPLIKVNDIIKKVDKMSFKLNPELLKENKRKDKKIVMAYDIETFKADESGRQLPYCICLSMFDDKGEIKTKSFYGLNCVNKFINYIDEHYMIRSDLTKTHDKYKKEQYYIYGYNNAMFDNTFIFSNLRNYGEACTYIVEGSSIKYIKVHNIHFYDLMSYYAGGLANVASSFKLELKKGVFPYSFMNAETLKYVGKVPDVKFWRSEGDYEEYIKENGDMIDIKEYTIKYCSLDTKITLLIVKEHLKNSVGIINGRRYDTTNNITAAGAAVNLFRQVFLNDVVLASPEKIQECERSAYIGGRCEVFKRSGENLYYQDINSSYPFSMTKKMPFRYLNTVVLSKDGKEVKISDICEYNLYLSSVKYVGNDENYIPPVCTRKDGNILGVRDINKAYIWGVELLEALKSECKVYIYEIISYEGKEIFNEYVTHLYQKRKEYKKTNPSMAQYIKIMLNSLYGKFAQCRKTVNILCKSVDEINDILSDDKYKLEGFDTIGDDYLLLKCDNIETSNIGELVRFSSYIAAISRSRLAEGMRMIGYKYVCYVDTDSIVSEKPLPDNYLDENELGLFKVEYHVKSAIFNAPKSYCLEVIEEDEIKEIFKAKGQRQQDVKEFLKVNNIKLFDMYEEIKNGSTYDILNKSAFKRSLQGINIINMSRNIRSVINKRVFNGNDSMPYKNVDEWKAYNK